jgi:hypothetical protein
MLSCMLFCGFLGSRCCFFGVFVGFSLIGMDWSQKLVCSPSLLLNYDDRRTKTKKGGKNRSLCEGE